MRCRLVSLLGVALFSAFSCSVTENGSIAFVWNSSDTDPFDEPDAAAPANISISTITVQSADGGGSSGDAATTLVNSPYVAGGTVTVPGQDGYDVDIVQATVFDSTNNAIIFGQSIPVQLGGIQNTTLDIFVQRTGQFARLPLAFSSIPESPLALAVEDRYLVVADGSGKSGAAAEQAQIYDMSAWAPVQASTALPCAPLSIAPLGGTLVLLLCAPGTATGTGCGPATGVIACGFDLGYIVATDTQLGTNFPPDCGLEDVAGGATVLAPDGDSFVVGGTRSGGMAPTRCVLKVGPFETTADGGTIPGPLTMGTFDAMRTGAAAAWSPTLGLVIAGGNLKSSDAPVEYLGSTADSDGGALVSSTLNGYDIGDLAQGSGVVIHDGDHALVLAGGTLPDGSVAGVRVFDLMCSGDDCEPDAGADAGNEASADASEEASADAAEEGGGETNDDAGEGAGADGGAIASVDLGSAQGFEVGPSSALFVGAAGARAGGQTRAFLVLTSGTSVIGMKAVPLQVTTRTNTTAIRSPVTSVVVVGGDTTMESFFP